MGNTHIFSKQEGEGISYKYLLNPEMREMRFFNYLEIERFKNKKLEASIMVSKKQVVCNMINENHVWVYSFDTGNKYTTLKNYTKKGSEWKIEKKFEKEKNKESVNLEYEVKSSIIDKCLKLIKDERTKG